MQIIFRSDIFAYFFYNHFGGFIEGGSGSITTAIINPIQEMIAAKKDTNTLAHGL